MTAKESRRLVEKEIKNVFGKRKFSKTVNGYRYSAYPVYDCFNPDTEIDIPEARIRVEKRCTCQSCHGNTQVYYRAVRRFSVDMLQLHALKQVPAEFNA